MMSEVQEVDVGDTTRDPPREEEEVTPKENGGEGDDPEADMDPPEPKPEVTNGGNQEKKTDVDVEEEPPTSMNHQINKVSNDLNQICSVTKPQPPSQQLIKSQQIEKKPLELKPIHTGDPKTRSKLRFEVVTARVIETGGKKHVAYTIMMKRVGHEPQPAVIERRYNDFCFIYECVLRSFHPSILGDFQFPKKVLLGNFKAEVIAERTDSFHKFLNLIANCDNLLYSDYFYSFLSSEEHNEAVSHIKLARYAEAIPLLETIFCVREKLLTIANVHVVLVLCELVACLSSESVGQNVAAYSYVLVAMRGFELIRGHPDVEPLRVSFLKLAADLASDLGQDKKQFDRQLSELRYSGVRLHNSRPLLEVIRDRYIHRASHTSKLS